MIKAVLFDFGGVLTESGKSGFVRQTVASLYDRPAEEIDIADLHYQLRHGHITSDQFFTTLNKRYGGHVTEADFLKAAHTMLVRSAAVYDLAAELRKQGIKTGILSNIFAMNAEALRKEGLYDGFDPVILSCEEGFAKPEHAFYEVAIKRLGVKPQEILFIDDQPKCLPPAQKLGIQVLLARSPRQIVADTRALIRAQNNQEV